MGSRYNRRKDRCNFDEQGGETARNSGSGGSKYDARINGGTVEWGPGLQQGAVRLSNKGHFKLPDGVLAHVPATLP